MELRRTHGTHLMLMESLLRWKMMNDQLKLENTMLET